MRVAAYFLSFIVILCSCDSKIEPLLNEIEGSWNLKYIEYEKINGEKTLVSNPDVVLELTSELATGSQVEGVRMGNQYFDGKVYPFEYSIDFSQNKIDLLFMDLDKTKLPDKAIGRNQVYNLEIIDKHKIKISSEIEFDYEKNTFEPRKNILYEFIKK